MTALQDGNALSKSTVYQSLDIFAYSKTKEDVVSSVNEILMKFVPEGTSLSITITKPAGSEALFATHVITGSLVT